MSQTKKKIVLSYREVDTRKALPSRVKLNLKTFDGVKDLNHILEELKARRYTKLPINCLKLEAIVNLISAKITLDALRPYMIHDYFTLWPGTLKDIARDKKSLRAVVQYVDATELRTHFGRNSYVEEVIREIKDEKLLAICGD